MQLLPQQHINRRPMVHSLPRPLWNNFPIRHRNTPVSNIINTISRLVHPAMQEQVSRSATGM
jgi:hypothetical protein